MNLIVVGFQWCPYFISTCTELSSANIEYNTVIAQDSIDLKRKVSAIKRLHPVRGISGQTSPQILRVEPLSVICIGGHDSLESIGMENVLSWYPLKF